MRSLCIKKNWRIQFDRVRHAKTFVKQFESVAYFILFLVIILFDLSQLTKNSIGLAKFSCPTLQTLFCILFIFLL